MYRISEKNTLNADQTYWVQEDIAGYITPDVLYPAVTNVMQDGVTALSAVTTGPNGSTVTSSKYGTVQSDGKMYYYTDIKGSKPIKDPRIGAHFGSQRYKFKSMQMLEQETGMHGDEVYSVDGREWLRAVGSNWTVHNTDYGNGIETVGSSYATDSHYFEIVGYFNDANYLQRFYSATINDHQRVSINGGTVQANDTAVSQVDPKSGRYVDPHSLINLAFDSAPTLGINTLKLAVTNGHYMVGGGIELIVHDTTSTATKSQIQIPSQNVVSYGKKFTVSGTPHYNPFAYAGDGTTAVAIGNTTSHGKVADGWTGSTATYFDSTLDTATSLGLSAWETGGDFYRPVNGGRIVRWVDHQGIIKTSVNMMPPEASQGGDYAGARWAINGGGTGLPTGTAWTTAAQPAFGNKLIGSNLVTSWINGDQTNGVPFDTTFSTSGANITEADSDGTVSYAKTNAFNLTKGKTYRLVVVHADVGAGGESPHIAVSGDISRSYYEMTYVQPDENKTNTLIFVAGKSTTDGRVYVQNNATAEWSGNFTLYEIEQPESQAEVAKTFHFREFGNGAANGGTNATYADFSMLSGTSDSLAYVMDDGLTAMTAKAHIFHGSYDFIRTDTSSNLYITFIGTGYSHVTQAGSNSATKYTKNVVQNLPYGTHLLSFITNTGGGEQDKGELLVDGVVVLDEEASWINYTPRTEVTFHQPKMPPIPDDAVILSDYMLMADFVPLTTAGIGNISKGVRINSVSTDFFLDTSDGNFDTMVSTIYTNQGFRVTCNTNAGSATATRAKLPSFGTNYVSRNWDFDDVHALFVDSSGSPSTHTAGGDDVNESFGHLSTPVTLGVHEFGVNPLSGSALNLSAFEVATPTHTSSHYQSFETMYLNVLVGGDRNMEQTNLVVSPDGKTWDQMTRDTSYLGNNVLAFGNDTQSSTNAALTTFDFCRGTETQTGHNENMYCKDSFALAYDRFICLKAGSYSIHVFTMSYTGNQGSNHGGIYVNGASVTSGHTSAAGVSHTTNIHYAHLDRGDYVQIYGRWYGSHVYSGFWIERI